MCYFDATCKSPVLRVILTDTRADKGDEIEIDVCAPHVDKLHRSRWSVAGHFVRWVVRAVTGRTRVTKLIDAETRHTAETYAGVNARDWTAIQSAPREWCPRACLIAVKRVGKHLTYEILHNSVYGCRAGVLAN
jgi:hypothetical protein